MKGHYLCMGGTMTLSTVPSRNGLLYIGTAWRVAVSMQSRIAPSGPELLSSIVDLPGFLKGRYFAYSLWNELADPVCNLRMMVKCTMCLS